MKRDIIVEQLIWVLFSVVLLIPQIIRFIDYQNINIFLLDEGYYRTLISLVLLVFPILFKLVFNYYPLEMLREKRTVQSMSPFITNKTISNQKNPKINEEQSCEEQIEVETKVELNTDSIVNDNELRKDDLSSIKTPEEKPITENQTSINLGPYSSYKATRISSSLFSSFENLEEQIYEARKISNRIFTRSGAYLFFGCIIAFGGIAIFLAFGEFFIAPGSNLVDHIFEMFPRFGILFFIEFLALFFLKQSRIMMEEFRYYEKVKRRLQDNFIIMNIVQENKDNVTLTDVMIKNYRSEDANSLITDTQTTEILETQKLLYQEQSPTDKLIELVKLIKK